MFLDLKQVVVFEVTTKFVEHDNNRDFNRWVLSHAASRAVSKLDSV